MKKTALLAIVTVALFAGCRTSTYTNGTWTATNKAFLYKTDFAGELTMGTNGTMTVKANVATSPDAETTQAIVKAVVEGTVNALKK